MRTIHTDRIKDAVKEMCIEANLTLSPDVESRICTAEQAETGELGKKILSQLKENMEIAKQRVFRFVRIPVWRLSFWKSDKRCILKETIWRMR